jgi:tetrahydromethanopterin S-methyltransferase subunit F
MFWGVQLKGFIIGLIFAYLLIPFIQRTMLSSKFKSAVAPG